MPSDKLEEPAELKEPADLCIDIGSPKRKAWEQVLKQSESLLIEAEQNVDINSGIILLAKEKIEEENLDIGMDIEISCTDKQMRTDTVPYACGFFNFMGNGDSIIEAVYNACVEYIKFKSNRN